MRSRAACVWARHSFVWSESSLDKLLSYLSHPRLHALENEQATTAFQVNNQLYMYKPIV